MPSFNFVDSETTIEANVLVFHPQRMLELKCDSIAIHLMSQAMFVYGFVQSRPEMPMNFDGTAGCAIRELTEFHLRVLRILRGSSPPR